MDVKETDDAPPYRELKGPKGYPIIGNLLSFSSFTLHKQADEWRKEFGPIYQCTVLYKKFIFVSSLPLMKQTCLNEKNSNRMPTFFGEYMLPYSIAMTKDRPLSAKLKSFMETIIKKQDENKGENSHVLNNMIQTYLNRVVALKGNVSVSSGLKDILSDFITIQVSLFLSLILSMLVQFCIWKCPFLILGLSR